MEVHYSETVRTIRLNIHMASQGSVQLALILCVWQIILLWIYYFNFPMSPFCEEIFFHFTSLCRDTKAMKETTALAVKLILCGDVMTLNLDAAARWQTKSGNIAQQKPADGFLFFFCLNSTSRTCATKSQESAGLCCTQSPWSISHPSWMCADQDEISCCSVWLGVVNI